jgi:hypothetical protein
MEVGNLVKEVFDLRELSYYIRDKNLKGEQVAWIIRANGRRGPRGVRKNSRSWIGVCSGLQGRQCGGMIVRG